MTIEETVDIEKRNISSPKSPLSQVLQMERPSVGGLPAERGGVEFTIPPQSLTFREEICYD